MRVLIQETLRPRSVTDYPTVVLRKDNWDDYGFKTMFYVRLHLGTDRVVDLETVKILHREQNGGPTPFPGTSFDSSFLHDEYCSLGQSYSYYELLHGLGEDVYRPYLDGMCDVVYSPTILAALRTRKASACLSCVLTARIARLRMGPSSSSDETLTRLLRRSSFPIAFRASRRHWTSASADPVRFQTVCRS